jgi:predicted nucleic acid-binding protein
MAKTVPGGGVKSKFHIFVDSDAFVGWLYRHDAHHKKSGEIFREIKKQRAGMVTSSWVILETATVLSNRKGQALAREFLKRMRQMRFPIIHMDENLQEKATDFFQRQQKKGTSVIDCGNVVVMNRFKIPTVFSFDKFYSRQTDIKRLE